MRGGTPTTTNTTSKSILQPTWPWNFDWPGLKAGMRPLFVYMAPCVAKSIAFMRDIFLTSSNPGAVEARRQFYVRGCCTGARQSADVSAWAKHSGVLKSDGELEVAFPRTYTSARGYTGAGHVAVGGPKDVMMSIDEELDVEQRVHTDCLALVHRSYSAQDAVMVRIDQDLAATATSNTNTTSSSTQHSLDCTPSARIFFFLYHRLLYPH